MNYWSWSYKKSTTQGDLRELKDRVLLGQTGLVGLSLDQDLMCATRTDP